MTTIIYLRGTDFILLCGDCQLSMGNLKYHHAIDKFHVASKNTIISSAGSLATSQYITDLSIEAVRELRHKDKLEFNVYPHELSKQLSEANYLMSNFISDLGGTSFLIAGLENDGTLAGYCVDADGSMIGLVDYFSMGSGEQISLGLLKSEYKPNLSLGEMISMSVDIMNKVSSVDIFTSQKFSMYLISLNGISKVNTEFTKKKIKFSVSPV